MIALITRPKEDAQGLRLALEKRGVAVMAEPMLNVVFEPVKPLDLTGVQGYLVTSANGARALVRAEAPRNLPLWAVGEASAECARSLGFQSIVAAGGDVASLSALVRERCRAESGTLLFASAREVAGDLAGQLGQAGFSVRREILYRTETPQAFSNALIEAVKAGRIRWAFFFSPRSGDSFATLARAAEIESCLGGVCALALSKSVAAGLAGLGWGRLYHSKRPSQDALLDLFDVVRNEENSR